MPNAKKRLVRIFLLLILITVTAIACAPLVPLSPLNSMMEARLSEMLGRNVTIDSVRLNLFSGPRLKIMGMMAREDPAFGDGVFMSANEVNADIDALAYLKTRRVVITGIMFSSPKLNFIKSAGGKWSWTTIGRPEARRSRLSVLIPPSVFALIPVGYLAPGNISAMELKRIRIENASVRLVDHSMPNSPDVVYTNIRLNAELAPHLEGDSAGTQARGELFVQSGDDNQDGALATTLPFDLVMVGAGSSSLSVRGSLGPGQIQTNNLRIRAFEVDGEIHSEKDTPLQGSGKMYASDLFVSAFNLSEQVARALKIDRIGDMNPGTTIARLETDFQISKGAFNTTDLRIQELDGLGDASAETGSFRLESALTVNYAATVTLSPDATSRVKSVSSLVGLVVTALETNDRFSVPLNINGDLRNPEIQVDVSRIF